MKKIITVFLLAAFGMLPAQLLDSKAADECFKKGDYKCAETAYAQLAEKERIMKIKSRHYNSMGIAQRRLGKAEQAMQSFENARKFDAENIDSYINLSSVHLQRGSKPKALEYANQGLGINPENQELTMIRAKIYEELKNNADAEKDYLAAIALNPENTLARANYASFKKNTGKLEEALKDYNQLISEKPESLIYNSRADLYIAMKKYKEASADVEKAIKLDAKFPLSYVTKAKLLFETNKTSEACQTLDKAIATGFEKIFVTDMLKKCGK